MQPVETRKGAYLISSDPALLQLNVIHQYLSEDSYWAKNIPLDIVRRSVNNSLCFGVYHEGIQVGFARVITDRATFGYLADVFILPAHRGQGLSKRLMETILSHPDLQDLRRMALLTEDAQGLYAQFGFNVYEYPERFMSRRIGPAYETYKTAP
ncbi:GNAT family N-acetyltransferase [Chitinophaga alhagiae]|uniref:GNAT family N-acetyltransferase n=1 Tax=Chitinophaga alhagiae TaxID=2203219 RepID=A0ABM6W8F4_9BACT|nr:GNAT family N-acetyltransferase [Chitinophaga alhagiae]AWO00238.1 GNAT family N-acetyltransferase [Chitinophaga alhagiae]